MHLAHRCSRETYPRATPVGELDCPDHRNADDSVSGGAGGDAEEGQDSAAAGENDGATNATTLRGPSDTVVTISATALIAAMIGALTMRMVSIMIMLITAVMMPLGLPPGDDA